MGRLRRVLYRKRMEKRGWDYHKHTRQIILSRDEIIIQLENFGMERHYNLAFCLLYGRTAQGYADKIQAASMKLEFVGSMFFPVGRSGDGKLPKKYYRRFFDSFLSDNEDASDVICCLQDGRKAGPQMQKELLRKYRLVRKFCLDMIANPAESYYASYYRGIIEAVIDDDPLVAKCHDGMELVNRLADAGRNIDINYGNIRH